MSLLARRNGRAALVTLAVGAVAVGVASAARGADGTWSALLATGLVIGSMSAASIPLVVAGDGRDGRGGLGFLVLLLGYALRIGVGLLLLRSAARSDVLDGQVVGLTVIPCAVAWTATQVVLGLSRKHAPTLEV